MNNPKNQLTHDQNYVGAVDQEKALNEIELKAINGMIAYVAYMQEVEEATAKDVLAATFNVEDVKTLPSRRYDEVINFLMNLQIAKAVN